MPSAPVVANVARGPRRTVGPDRRPAGALRTHEHAWHSAPSRKANPCSIGYASVRTVAAAVAAARAPLAEVRGGEDEQAGGGVEVAGLAFLDGAVVGLGDAVLGGAPIVFLGRHEPRA